MSMMPLRRLEVLNMYLSRVQLATENRQKIHNLTHLGAYHDWVERSFPQEIEQGERKRKLWRIEHLHGKTYLLIVSQEMPDMTALCRYGVVGTAETKNYDLLLNRLKNGMRCRFRIVLNPVMAVAAGMGKRGRVVPHITAAHQLEYLKKRTEKYGFSLQDDEYDIVERDFPVWRKNKERIRLSRVVYEGILTIKDADLFRDLLIHGMGKKKAYGFGMMTVIPLEV